MCWFLNGRKRNLFRVSGAGPRFRFQLLLTDTLSGCPRRHLFQNLVRGSHVTSAPH